MDAPLKFVDESIEDYAMQVTYDPAEGTGRVIYNISFIKNEDFEYAVSVLKDACRTGLSVSSMVKFCQSGEKIDSSVIPSGWTGICTICSITFDGLLIRRGVPMNPIGGGLVEIENRTPIRFTHMIQYEYTTVDPLQVLISQKLTSVNNVMRKGSGNILANIREFHMEAEPLIGMVIDELLGSKLTGILEVGMPNVPLLGVPVSPQYLAVAAVGGTNPMAAIRESGRRVRTQAMKGLMDIRDMIEIRDY